VTLATNPRVLVDWVQTPGVTQGQMEHKLALDLGRAYDANLEKVNAMYRAFRECPGGASCRTCHVRSRIRSRHVLKPDQPSVPAIPPPTPTPPPPHPKPDLPSPMRPPERRDSPSLPPRKTR
jgi:hypothetical protein